MSHKRGPSHTRSHLPLNLRNISPDLYSDLASDARLIDDKVAEREWVIGLEVLQERLCD